MAAYKTLVKTFITPAPSADEISSTAGTYSAKISDYVDTLDDGTETILSMDVTKKDGSTYMVTILHKTP